jgi:uncharacterized protein YqjF (DUF2071 family)
VSLQAPVGQMEGRRRPLRLGHVLVTIQDLLIVTWRRDPGELHSLLPPVLAPATVDGAAFSSVLVFRNRALRPAYLRFPRFSGPQVNVRTYVLDPATGRAGAVYFHSIELASRAVSTLARTLLRVPFFHRRFRLERRGHGGANWSARGDGIDVSAVEGEARPAPDSLVDLWTNPHSGYFVAPSGRLKGWSIWHRAQQLRSLHAERLILEPAARIGLEGRAPVSIYLVESVDYEVYLPPRTVRVGAVQADPTQSTGS